jgi:hypothetical protein
MKITFLKPGEKNMRNRGKSQNQTGGYPRLKWLDDWNKIGDRKLTIKEE